MAVPTHTQLKVFISRAGKSVVSVDLAIKIYDWLTADGHQVELQDRTLLPGTHIHDWMGKCLRMTDCEEGKIIALYSKPYFESEDCKVEALYSARLSALNRGRRLIPLKMDSFDFSQVDEELTVLADLSCLDMQPFCAAGDDAATKAKIYWALGLPTAPPPPGPKIQHPSIFADPDFVGRKDVFERITQSFSTTNRVTALTALKGMGGIGKSAAAREYAVKHGDTYHALWQVNADDATLMTEGLLALGERLNPDGNNPPDTQKERLAYGLKKLNQFRTVKPVLIIYDNARHPDKIADYLPEGAGYHVLVTSRYPDFGILGQSINIEMLPIEDATDLLLQTSGRSDSVRESERESERDAARALALRLGRLPLALRHAGSYLKNAAGLMDFIGYGKALDKSLAEDPGSDRAKSRPGFYWRPDSVSATDYADSIWAALKLSLDDLKRTNNDAWERLAVFSNLAEAAIPAEILTHQDGVDETDAISWLDAMRLHACIDKTKAGDIVVHNLLAEMVQHMRGPTNRERDVGRALHLVAHGCFASGQQQDITNASAFERYKPHAEHLAALPNIEAHKGHTYLFNILNYLGLYYKTRAEYAPAEEYLRQQLQVGQRHLEEEDPNFAATLNNLATLFFETNRLADAEPIYRRVINIYTTNYGMSHASLASAMGNLGALLYKKNELVEAEELFRNALEMDESISGNNDPIIAVRLNNLAGLCETIGRIEEAENMYKRALEIDEAEFGPNHPRFALRLNNLASLFFATNRLEEAEDLSKRALKIDEAFFGSEHPRVAKVLKNIAVLFARTNRSIEAYPMAQRAAEICLSTYGSDHPDTQTALGVRDQIAQHLFLQLLPPEAHQELERISALPEAEQPAAIEAFMAKINPSGDNAEGES